MAHPALVPLLSLQSGVVSRRQAMQVGLMRENVYLTLCGGHPEALREIVDAIPADRLLWGSDYLGPGSEELFAYRMGLMDLLGLSPERRRAILQGNPARLFGIRIEGKDDGCELRV